MSASASPAVQDLIAYFANADAVADRLGYTDAAYRPAYHQHIMMVLSLAYIETFGSRAERPDWVPHIPFYMPWGAPNPDDIYRFAPCDAKGTYRFFGKKGTSPVALLTFRTGGANVGEINGRNLAEVDLTTVDADAQGNYSFIVSPERPAGYAGPWHPMPPATTSLLYRSRTNTPEETDPICKIERLDVPPPRLIPTPDEQAHRLKMMVTFATKQNEFLLSYLNRFRDRGGDKGFVSDDQSGYGGVATQRVLMHLFELQDDEALILETELPETVRYWSVQIYDRHFSAVDYVFHQASLNGYQAKTDSDGRLRVVVSARDPGVPNWLDTGGWTKAGAFWRWTYASSYPVPSVTKVKFADVRRHLPKDTPEVSTAERTKILSARSSYYQTRGR